MNRNTRTLIVLAVAVLMAGVASFGVYLAVRSMPVREVEIARTQAVVAARPLQAALASAATFAVGAILPVLTALLAPAAMLSALVTGVSGNIDATFDGDRVSAGGEVTITGTSERCGRTFARHDWDQHDWDRIRWFRDRYRDRYRDDWRWQVRDDWDRDDWDDQDFVRLLNDDPYWYYMRYNNDWRYAALQDFIGWSLRN